MIRVLFVCHGNICRSPMAEFIFRDMVAKRGLAAEFSIASAATSREEIGNPVYPPAKRKLKEHGIDPAGKTARQMTAQDYKDYDYLLAAERYNIRNMERITGGDPQHKIFRLLDLPENGVLNIGPLMGQLLVGTVLVVRAAPGAEDFSGVRACDLGLIRACWVPAKGERNE